jgi:gliding motility-associated-like protein
MKLSFNLKILQVLCCLFFFSENIFAQRCTTLGQTPSTAFPVCGTTVFKQTNVPICASNDLFVPGCSGNGNANYQNKNPFFYKFTCYVSGTLGFLITPLADNEDYDWQLYDITGHNPNDIFTNNSLVVTGNWSGSYGPTGTSSSGVNFIQCGSDPTKEDKPRFAQMPALIAGHIYLLLISHFTDTQSGYDLSFGGGTADITDPNKPHMKTVKPDCDGTKLTLFLNKRIRCNSITGSGSEFSISPAVTTVISAETDSCAFGFDFAEVTVTLASALPNGNYDLVINNGSDGNTLLDICGNAITQGEKISFFYAIPKPIFADSIGKPKCTHDSLRVYFPKKIKCSSIAPDGSDFSVTGPTAVTVTGAGGNCVNDKTPYVLVKFASPIYTKGNYQLTLKAGNDGTVIIDECGQETPVQSLSFTTADTVSALFQYTGKLGCRKDTLTFFHDGAHDVNNWSWVFNNAAPVTGPRHTLIFPATSTNDVQLSVSNGVCSAKSRTAIKLDNEVKADFTMPDFLCPEDKLEVTNTSTGLIDKWRWNFDVVTTSDKKDPAPFLFPNNNRETYYTVKLLATNTTLNCSDSTGKRLTVLDNCLIAVPTGFTPNNDGLNDYFWPHNALKADNLEFRVYNRWGQLVFQSKSWRDKWDGSIKGALQASGVYVWLLRYTNKDTKKEVFQKGTVMLIR